MRRYLLPLSILAGIALFLIAACGGDGGPDVIVITSDDGKLTLEIQPGSLADDVEIAITTVPLAELPEPLSTVRGAGTGYKLEPDGLEFSELVAVTLELERSELDPEDETTITAYALVTQSADGELEVLPEQSLEWTLGEESVAVSGQLSHFSWITRTKGSLTVALTEVKREQPVGGSFTTRGEVGNSDDSGSVTLVDVKGTFQAFGPVSKTGGITTFTFEGDAPVPADNYTVADADFQCDEAGIGSYGLIGEGTSVRTLPDGRELRTNLRVVVDSVVECVAEEEATEVPTPTPAATAAPEDTPDPTSTPAPAAPTATPAPVATAPPSSGAVLAISCEHTNPGVSSELIVRVSGLTPGQMITGEASRGGLIAGFSNFDGVADSTGSLEIRVTIFDFGEWNVILDSGLSGSFTVGEVCPG